MTSPTEIIDFSTLDRPAIGETLQRLQIPLTVEEALTIQNELLGRPPTLTELVLFSIEGSEHCSYKSSRPHLEQFTTTGPDVIIGAQEDAGVVSIATDRQGRRYTVVVSHESHNHPSQIVPYEGAATGIGGNVRDVLCMGAEVIALSDSFRFGELKNPRTKWIHEGVVAGIAGYGNPLGIPNIGGDIYYHPGYNENCLVTIVTLGIAREEEIIHSQAPENADDYDLILIGKPTDNSGFGGASFASLELEEDKKEHNKGAVQEPNAFLERHLVKATLALFKHLQGMGKLPTVGFKDLGAGGVACASVELADAAGYGAEVWLDKVPVSMENLHPSVILCSETQERFMWVAPPTLTPFILKHYNEAFALPAISTGACATVIGRIRGDGRYIVHYHGAEIVNAPARQVTRGFLYHRPMEPAVKQFEEPELPEPENYNHVLLELLSHENIASREPVYETYDKQVQGRTVIEAGQADAGVLAPFNDPSYPEEIQAVGIALSTDHNPRYSLIDPYWGAVNAVVEAVRNVTAVGATPVAISDCLCSGNPENPQQMWTFAQATKGIAEACEALTVTEHPGQPIPIIAGNVSFYNETDRGPIPPSPIISCLGKIEDISNVVTLSFKKPGSTLFLVGGRKAECGGSVYYSLSGEMGHQLPKPNLQDVVHQCQAIREAIQHALVLSSHDIADGGIAVALAEMSFERSIGCEVTIPGNLRLDSLLFSETGGFILEVPASKVPYITTLFHSHSVPLLAIGTTTRHEVLNINERLLLPISRGREAWECGLRDKLR